jgi:hypothetical protein
MAANNRLWGAERIRGELLKLDIQVSKRTIQKYMKQIRATSSPGTELGDFLAQSCSRGMGLFVNAILHLLLLQPQIILLVR